MPGPGNQPRFTGERILLLFALLMVGLAVFQVVQAARRERIEFWEDSLEATAVADSALFPGILEKNYVTQFWEPLTTFRGVPLFRRSSGVENWHDADKIFAVGQTDDDRYRVYQAEWAEGDGVFVMKIAATNPLGEARFVEVGPQLYFREQYEAQRARWQAEDQAKAAESEEVAESSENSGEVGAEEGEAESTGAAPEESN